MERNFIEWFFRPRKRKPLSPGMCEAKRTRPAVAEFEGDEEYDVFRVCRSVARRLDARRLRPIEYFNLGAVHGTFHHLLHGDYYDEFGRSLQSRWRVFLGYLFPAPRLEDVKDDVEWLLDYAIVDDYREKPIIDALCKAPFDQLLKAIQGRMENGSSCAEASCYEILEICGTPAAADFVRGRWTALVPADGDLSVRSHYVLNSLIGTFNRCLPAEERISLTLDAASKTLRHQGRAFRLDVGKICEGLAPERGFDVCVEYLKGVSKRDLGNSARCLLDQFASTRTLDWIEANVFDYDTADADEMAPDPGLPDYVTAPVFSDWGQLASVSQLSWPRVTRWLGAGKPLARVAIDALGFCGKLQPENIGGNILEKESPLLEPAPVGTMNKWLDTYAREDGSPEVVRDVGLIKAHWPEILAGLPPKR